MHCRQMMIALAALAIASVPAAGQEHPLILPTRDVTVDYLTTGGPGGGNEPRTMRIFVAANGTKMRVETAAMPGSLIIDRIRNQMLMVMQQQHVYLEMPMDPSKADIFLLHDAGGFTRQGSEKLAGLACTVWTVHGGGGDSGCVTADGVLLRGQSTVNGQHFTLVATAVKYGKLPADTFQPPADFQKMNMPAGLLPGVARSPPAH